MVEQVQKGGAVCEDTESNASEIRLLLAEQKDIMKFQQIAQRQFMDEMQELPAIDANKVYEQFEK